MSTEKTENSTKNEIVGKTETATKKRDTRKKRKMSEKEEIISAIFAVSEWALQMEEKGLPEIADYIFKMMALTKYSGFFTRHCVKFIVNKAQDFSRSVREKSGEARNCNEK